MNNMLENTYKRGLEILKIVDDNVKKGIGTTLVFLVEGFTSAEPITEKYGWGCVSASLNPETLDLYLIVKVGELL